MFLKYNYTHISFKSQGGKGILMCSVYSRFPLANDADLPVYRCGFCDEGICEGERYYKVGVTYFHEECLRDNYCNAELLKLFGATPRVATRDEISLRVVGVINGR